MTLMRASAAVPLLVGAGLCAVIALEWLPQSAPDDAGPSRVAAAPRPPPPRATADHAREWAAASLRRPLFAPDRRPPSIAASPVAGPRALPRLTGTLVTALDRRAIFADGPVQQVLGEGARLDAWRIERIAAGQVTLSGPDGSRTVAVAFGAPQQSSVAPAAPVATSWQVPRDMATVVELGAAPGSRRP